METQTETWKLNCTALKKPQPNKKQPKKPQDTQNKNPKPTNKKTPKKPPFEFKPFC